VLRAVNVRYKESAGWCHRKKGQAAMQMRQVILANQPRLLRGMLKRVIAKTPDLQVVGEAANPAELSSIIEQTSACCVIVTLWPEGLMPSALESLLMERSSVCILGVAPDGSQARVKRSESPEENLRNLSLGKLIAVLREGLT
jgi:hypothetical protein